MSPYFAINEPKMKILYRKGKANDADALSRRSDLIIQLHDYENCTFEKELEEFPTYLSAMSHLLFDDKILTKVKQAILNDPALNGHMLPPGVSMSSDNLYWFEDKSYIPNDRTLIDSIIAEFHYSNGHPNVTRTLANISQMFYFPRMSKIVKQFCKKCHVCERIKSETTLPYGINIPLPVPSRPWEYVSMDLLLIYLK